MTTLPDPDDTRSITERMLASDLFIADKPEIFEDADFSLDLTAP